MPQRSSAWSDWESSATTAGTSRGRRAGRRAGPRSTPPAATPPGPAARAARPGSRRGRTRRRTASPGIAAPRSGSAAEAGVTDVAHRPGDGVRLELDADERRLREPLGDGDQPPAAAARDVEDAAAGGQAGGKVRQLGEALLEEDRDVLDRHRLDRAVEPRRPLRDRLAGPEEVRSARRSRGSRRRRRRTGRRGTPAGCRRAGPTPCPRRGSPVPRRTRRSRWRGPPGPRPRPAPARSLRPSRSHRRDPATRVADPANSPARDRGRRPS